MVPIPAEAFDDEPVNCGGCDILLEEPYFCEDNYYCEEYMQALVDEVRVEAEAYARAHCRITRHLPRYEPAREYRCTPDEYENG